MKINVDLKQVFSNEEQESIPEQPQIDTEKIKSLTMDKIQNKKRNPFAFTGKYTRVASVLILIVLLTSVSAFAFNVEGFSSMIGKLMGVDQSKVLVVGESVANRNYSLKVHEIVTDAHIGHVVISVEALSDKSKENFAEYRINLNYIGSGYGLSELDEYRKEYIKYYEISFSGSRREELEFSIKGMYKRVKVKLNPTVEVFNLEMPEDNSNGYQFDIATINLSELGLTLAGSDTRNDDSQYLYRIELLFADGTKTLVDAVKDKDDSPLHGNPLFGGGSGYFSGDEDDRIELSYYFRKSIPLEKIKQVIVNDIAYDVK